MLLLLKLAGFIAFLGTARAQAVFVQAPWQVNFPDPLVSDLFLVSLLPDAGSVISDYPDVCNLFGGDPGSLHAAERPVLDGLLAAAGQANATLLYYQGLQACSVYDAASQELRVGIDPAFCTSEFSGAFLCRKKAVSTRTSVTRVTTLASTVHSVPTTTTTTTTVREASTRTITSTLSLTFHSTVTQGTTTRTTTSTVALCPQVQWTTCPAAAGGLFVVANPVDWSDESCGCKRYGAVPAVLTAAELASYQTALMVMQCGGSVFGGLYGALWVANGPGCLAVTNVFGSLKLVSWPCGSQVPVVCRHQKAAGVEAEAVHGRDRYRNIDIGKMGLRRVQAFPDAFLVTAKLDNEFARYICGYLNLTLASVFSGWESGAADILEDPALDGEVWIDGFSGLVPGPCAAMALDNRLTAERVHYKVPLADDVSGFCEEGRYPLCWDPEVASAYGYSTLSRSDPTFVPFSTSVTATMIVTQTLTSTRPVTLTSSLLTTQMSIATSTTVALLTVSGGPVTVPRATVTRTTTVFV